MSGFYSSIAIPVLIDAIAVLGLYVIASSGRLSIGHAAFFGIGCYVSAILSTQLTLPFWASIVLGAVAAGVFGLVFAMVAERLGHWFFAIATLAFSVMLSGIVSSVESLGGATGIYGIPIAVGVPAVLVSLAAVLVLVYWIDRSSLGRSLRAVRDSEIAAEAVGINPAYAHAGAFAIGTAIAGLAGGLWAHYLGVIKPVDMSLDRSLFFLIYLAVGGIEHWAGALLGTVTLGMLPEVLRFSREYRLAFFGLLLTGFMVLRPSGFVSRQLINRIAPRVEKIWGERHA